MHRPVSQPTNQCGPYVSTKQCSVFQTSITNTTRMSIYHLPLTCFDSPIGNDSTRVCKQTRKQAIEEAKLNIHCSCCESYRKWKQTHPVEASQLQKLAGFPFRLVAVAMKGLEMFWRSATRSLLKWNHYMWMLKLG